MVYNYVSYVFSKKYLLEESALNPAIIFKLTAAPFWFDTHIGGAHFFFYPFL